MKIMRVLLIDQIAKVNFRYTYPMVRGLINNSVEVYLVIDQKVDSKIDNCTIENLFITDEKNVGKIKKLFNYLKSYRRILKIIQENSFDVIHSEWYIFSPIDYYFLRKIKKQSRAKYVATIHDILPFNQKFYDMYFHKKLYDLADSIILQAPSNVDRFAKLFPESAKKSVMIPHGHMLDYVERVDKYTSREKLQIPYNKIVFLFFGQIKKVKGVDILLSAFSRLIKEHEDVHLVIAGSVWKSDYSICQEIIDNNDFMNSLTTRIEYIPDDEVKYYYSAADVCVLPYTNIYQSGVIQLAYGYKKPVICSDLPAFTQFVKENISGFVAKPGDINSLYEAMKRALSEKSRFDEIGEAGYRRVSEELDWEKLTARIKKECYI